MITKKYAGNAVYAKVKALYGKRLTQQNYNELLQLHSVNEIAEYLKTKTSYSEIFKGLNSNEELQRSRLKNMLFNKLYNDFESIERFQKASGSELFKYFVIKFDIDQLTDVLSSMGTKSDKYFFTFPVFYNERSNLDLYALAKVKSREELLDLTQHTIYNKALKSSLTDYSVTNNPLTVQTALGELLDNEFLNLTSGKNKQKNVQLDSLYRLNNDIDFIKTLFRLTRFSLKGKDVLSPRITGLTPHQMNLLLEADGEKELTSILETTYLASIIASKTSGADIYHCADNYLFSQYHKTLCRSQNGDSVMFAYLHLAENEIRNLIHIIEGIRYGISPAEILPMLSIPH